MLSEFSVTDSNPPELTKIKDTQEISQSKMSWMTQDLSTIMWFSLISHCIDINMIETLNFVAIYSLALKLQADQLKIQRFYIVKLI